MKYRKISIETTTEAVDYISAMMDELGLEGIQIEDKVPLTQEEKEAMFIDILPELGEDDGTAIVSSYVDMDVDMEELVKGVKQGLLECSDFVDIGKGEVNISVTDDKDWLNNWKEFFKPFRVTDDIVIKPTWEELKEKKTGDLVIEIDPGTAFGTGSHETTRLCIEALEEVIGSPNKKDGDSRDRCSTSYSPGGLKLLDVGCGSGILSILALKLGVGMVRATEVDENAIEVSWENLKVNGIVKDGEISAESGPGEESGCVVSGYKTADIDIHHGDIINDKSLQEKVGEGIYDIVVANILADIIIPLSGEIGKHLKHGGIFISSGILNTKREEVEKAITSNGFTIIKVSTMNDWVSIISRNNK